MTAPTLGWLEGSLHPFAVSALLALGMVYATLVSRSFGHNGPGLDRSYMPRILVTGLLWSVLSPVLLTYGLTRANGIAACLLLNLEAVFATILGVLLHRERIGWRFALGLSSITTGAIVLMGSEGLGEDEMLGLIAVTAATILMSVESALSLPLSRLDSSEVMFWKGVIGCVVSVPLTLLYDGVPGSLWPAAAVLLCGVIGYGATERFYLMSQRTLGVARTSSLFSTSPLFGASLALLWGAQLSTMGMIAGALMAVGVVLHIIDTEPASKDAPDGSSGPPLVMPPPSWTREIR